MTRITTLLAAALLLVGCGGGGGGGPGGPPFGIAQRTIISGLTFPTGLPTPSQLTPVRAFPNLNFDRPLYMTVAPGSTRLYVVEQDGRIRVFANDAAATTTETFLDIAGAVSRAGNEEGLLGLAFDPDYVNNGYFYVYYSLASPRRSRLSRFTRSATNANRADAGSEVILLEFSQPFSNHNGGCLQFGPDGKLYVASGDGGSGGDPQNNAQDMTTLLGKLLRVNPDGTVPGDNPFAGQGGGVRGEIWAYGLRNPWRFSFDRQTGELWLGDVGQGRREEIDIIVRGGNYGWRLFEGNDEFNNPANEPASNFEAPVIDYSHSFGASVTGGYVYRGPTLTSVLGAYLYADFVSGRVWAAVYDGSQIVSNAQVASVNNPASFAEDADGEVYVCSFDGNIYKFEESGGGGAQFPQTLSATGLFSNLATMTPTPGIIEYEINAPFWSDGSHKRRWIAVPGTARITFQQTGAWAFPVGTVIVKHFEMDLATGGRTRLETRVLIHHDSGWQGYTYRWNQAQTDADLLAGAESEIIATPQGDVTWSYPSRADCLTCHTVAAGRILGPRTRQLNRDFAFPNATDNQLRTWNHIGLFSNDIGDAAQYEALPDPTDAGAPLADRARSYLHTNCAFCHLPNGPTPVNLDFRYGIPLASMNAVSVPPTTGLGVPSTFRISPFNRGDSQVYDLIGRLGGGRMPPIASTVVDDVGRELIGQWIDAGPD